MDGRSFDAGKRLAALRLLSLALEILEYEGTEVEAARWIKEREELVAVLRSACEEFGDNDWDSDLHLGDVVEKHLCRYLR